MWKLNSYHALVALLTRLNWENKHHYMWKKHTRTISNCEKGRLQSYWEGLFLRSSLFIILFHIKIKLCLIIFFKNIYSIEDLRPKFVSFWNRFCQCKYSQGTHRLMLVFSEAVFIFFSFFFKHCHCSILQNHQHQILTKTKFDSNYFEVILLF